LRAPALRRRRFEAAVTYRTTDGGGGEHIELQIGDSRPMGAMERRG
jgi:hypothetical protein